MYIGYMKITVPFYARDFIILLFWNGAGGPETNSRRMPRDNCN